MKTIKIRALYFKAIKPAMKTVDVDDDFFDQIPCGISNTQLAQMLGLSCPEYVRRYQIQCDGKIIYSSPNMALEEYPCDSRPW